MRTWQVVAAALVCLAVAGGCTGTGLVHDPPAPYFGPRVPAVAIMAGGGGTVSGGGGGSTTVLPGSRTSWNTAAWRVDGPERPWRFIVIHHSATTVGNATEFDRMHREKGWDELGYHFVIGNGTGSGNGQIEIGSRWPKQKHGAHCKVEGHPEYNDVGIGICLVGNFDVTRPTEGQMAALAKLVRSLMDRYNIPRNRIYGHGQLKPTDCPGRYFDYNDLWRRLG